MEDLSSSTFNFGEEFVNDEDCYFNITYYDKIFSNSVVCLFQCRFISIKSNNAAVTISLRNSIGFKNLVYNCSFKNCSSNYCGALFINMPNKCVTEIINTVFEHNSAFEKYSLNYNKAGAIYVTSENNNDILIKNCIFKFNDSKQFGGAIHISKMNYLFEECSFVDNYLNSRSNGNGGAIYFINSIGKLKKCNLTNNYIKGERYYTGNYFLFGGAISLLKSNISMEECNFSKNSAIGKDTAIFGSAISLDDSEGTFNKCIFDNNKMYSNEKYCYGGAIYLSKTKRFFNECSFINNTAISKSFNSHGGAVNFQSSIGELINCSFTNNMVETQLENFLITGDCPHTYGGAVYSDNSTLALTNCSFRDNIGSGNSPEFITTGYGGAFHSSFSNVKLRNCSFNNNSLYNYGYKFDFDCYIKGGACNFENSNVELESCEFNSNTAKIQVRENSKFFSAKIYGGALCYDNINNPIICKNCVFINNSVSIPYKHQNEFAGAIYLTIGELTNCTFIGNIAFNACDIGFDHKKNSFLSINNINFNNSKINSIVCFQTNNLDKFKVIMSTTFFNTLSEIMNKFTCINDNNCTNDDIEQLSEDKKMTIFNDDNISSIELNLGFEYKCYISKNKLKHVEETQKIDNDKQIPIILFIRIILIFFILVLLILILMGIISRSMIKSTKKLNLE